MEEREAYFKMEDGFFEQAYRLLTTKVNISVCSHSSFSHRDHRHHHHDHHLPQETSEEDINAFLESSSLKELEDKRTKINDTRSKTLRVATEAYNRVDDCIQQLGKKIYIHSSYTSIPTPLFP